MKTCAIYVRKSTLTDKGKSINNQINMCKSYARDNSILIDESFIYVDEGYSGKDTNRPRFKKMLDDLQKNKFNTIICYRLDRISRSINDFSNLINILEKYKVGFISIKENFDTHTPMGRSMMYIASVFSELERETIRERIKDNLYGLARSGRWLGGITPTGYESKGMVLLNDDLHKKKIYELKAIDSEITLIKTLFNNFLKFNSLSKLEDYCKKNELKSKNNLSFSQNTLKQILINPVYAIADKDLYDYLLLQNYSISNKKSDFNGKYGVLSYEINGESLISLSSHKGIIKSNDWIYIQEFFLRQNKVPSRQGTSSIGLLSGLIYCKICNSLMRVKYGRKTKNGVSFYYLCTLKEKDSKSCSSKNLRGSSIDDMICEKVKSSLMSEYLPSYILKYLISDRKFTKRNNNPNKYIDKDKIQGLASRLKTLEVQLDNNKNSSSSKYILKEIKSINNNINNKIYKSYNYNSTYKEDGSLLLDEIIQLFKNITFDFNICPLSFNDKKYFLNEIISYIYWDNFKLVIYFK